MGDEINNNNNKDEILFEEIRNTYQESNGEGSQKNLQNTKKC